MVALIEVMEGCLEMRWVGLCDTVILAAGRRRNGLRQDAGSDG